MRQFDFVYDKILKVGLRQDAPTVDGQFLTKSLNGLPLSGVLTAVEQFTETFPTIKKDIQIFSTIQGVFVFTVTELYSWDGVVLNQLVWGIPAGGPWSVADFSPVLMFVNGACNVVRTATGEWVVNHSKIPKIYTTIGSFRGRVLAGIGKTLDWSRIGEAKFLSDEDTSRENEAGTRDMDWSGTIYSIQSLGKYCVVYGSGGITILELASVNLSDFQTRQMINTFKFDNIDYVGVPGVQAVLKISESEHRFVSNDGYLYSLTTEGKKKLGYKEFIPANPKLSYSFYNNHGLLVVGGSNPSLVVSDSGAGQISFDVTIAYDKRVGLMTHASGGVEFDQSIIELWSDTLNFDRPGEKSIEQIVLDGQEIEVGTSTVSVGVKMTTKENWTFSEWFTLNENLEAPIGVTGVLFMIKLRIPNQVGLKLQGLKIGVKFTDRRYVRGVSGAPRNDNQASS